ncbi:MAG: hypothetical protein JSU72_19370 [Deltaproteobacteria bacterium]|nr:MAG: hypothetical protein JSU72_19370 [Deltaproteobacteria bacterium]
MATDLRARRAAVQQASTPNVATAEPSKRWRGRLIVVMVMTVYLLTWAFFTVGHGKPVWSADSSWEMGLVAALDQGDWAGRDTFFTYGPLYQLISYAGARLNVHGSVYDGNISAHIAVVWLAICLLGICVLLMRPLGAFQAAFLYFGLAITGMLGTMSVRVLAGLLAVLLFYWSLVCAKPRGQMLAALGAGILAFLTQLLSFEAGIYAIITIIGVSIVCALASRVRWLAPSGWPNNATTSFKLLAIAIGTYLVANLAISFLYELSSDRYPGIFAYQLRSLEILAIYSRSFGVGWVLPSPTTILWITLVAMTTLVILVRIRTAAFEEGSMYLCLLIYSLALLKSATVRSDVAHVAFGTLPILLTFLSLGRYPVSRRLFVTWAAVFALFVVLWPESTLSPVRFGLNLVQGDFSFGERLSTLREANSSPLDPSLRYLVAQHPERSLLAYPYQNYIPVVAERTMVAPFLQSYVASSEHLQEQYVAALEQEPGTFDVIYSVDDVGVWAVDGVQSIARTPLIFEYLFDNFRLADPYPDASGHLLLERGTSPGELRSERLPFSADGDNCELTIQPAQPSECSLIRLTLQISYPVWSVFGHSTPISLRFFSASEMVAETNLVALSSSEPFETYVSLLSPVDFHRVFGRGTVPRVQWDRLVISAVDGGLFGFEPRSVEISKVECISVLGFD